MMIDLEHPNNRDVPALKRLWHQAFGDEENFLNHFFSEIFAPDHGTIARIDGEIAGMLYWFDCTLETRKFAYLYAVATDEALKGKGIATRLLEYTHGLLKLQGYSGAILVPGSEGLFQFYEKRGYERISRVAERTVRSGIPVQIKKISAEEYCAKRLEFLPEHSIDQRGSSAVFLESMAECYLGEYFAAAVSPDHKFCMEFAGNPEEASGLAAALDCESMICRGPGDQKDFAMGISWDHMAWPFQLYFGLAFD